MLYFPSSKYLMIHIPKTLITVIVFSFLWSIFLLPVAFAIENTPPVITLYPSVYYAGDEVLHIEGRATPSSNIEIIFSSIDWPPRNFTVGTDTSGKWIFLQRLFLEKGRWEIKVRNMTTSSSEAVWSDPASFISVPTVFVIGGLKIKFSTLNNFIFASLASIVVIVIFAIFRYKSVQKQIKAFQMGSTESVIKEKINDVRRDVNDELWHLENKLKQGGSFSQEESEHHDQLLNKLKKLEEDVEGEIAKNL